MFEAVVAQAKLLDELGATPVVIGLREESSAEDRWRFGDIEINLVEQAGLNALGFSPDLPGAIADARPDLLHLHGIWQYPSLAAADWADGARKPLVISPHGMMDPWITSRRAWKKHLARMAWERRAWRSASAFHALTEDEAQDIGNETRGARVATIPNPAPRSASPEPGPRAPFALYIGRIHAKKNLATLVDAWQAARADLPEGAMLTIAGWGDDADVASLEHAIQQASGIDFVGTAFGSQKAALLDLARFVVLPSHSEGLPMAMLEAWAAGVPTIMTEHCHLPEGFAAGAAIECGTDRESIRKALVEGFGLGDTQWQEMSDAAFELARGPFGADAIAARWEALYSALLAV